MAQRLLLVPTLTELEWRIRPLLDEWAEVATFDAPGIGEEPAPEQVGAEATAQRGLEELDRRGRERCVVVGEHEGCIGHMKEGFEDVVAAFPDAAPVSCPVKPTLSPEFAEALRAFCDDLARAEGEPATPPG